jgi:hypothetical protein
MEHQEVTAMIALDLSAAFDTVDHNILFDVLAKQYGLCSTALDWINSYLRPRSCRVSVNSSLSSARSLECSVPQGGCLGPWLYLTYAGTLFDIIPPLVTVHGFADGHTENVRFNLSNENAEKNSIETLENCALETNNWMNGNKLKMNKTKTEFIEFGSKHQCSLDIINIAGDEIESKNCIHYLSGRKSQFQRPC